MATLPDAEVIVHGLLVSLDERTDFTTKAVKGYRATVVGAGGGAAVVNFGLEDAMPFAPLMSQIIWRVRSGAWSMDGGSSGMSTRFLGTVDTAHLEGLARVLSDNAAQFPDKTAK